MLGLNDDLAKPLLKIKHRLVITSHGLYGCKLIHDLNSMLVQLISADAGGPKFLFEMCGGLVCQDESGHFCGKAVITFTGAMTMK